jgi:hypothetical protein
MSKGFQLATLAGALTLAMSGASAIELSYTGWTVGGATGGQIDESAGGVCNKTLNPTVSCSVVASGDGFKQINVSDSNDTSSGESYIMTIVTDQNAGAGASLTPGDAGLGFFDVSFVKMKLTLGGSTPATNQNGIKGHQEINEVKNGATFLSSSDINTGWSIAAAPMTISQTLKDPGSSTETGDDFESGFLYRSQNGKNADGTDSGIRTGFEMSIDQTAGLATGSNLATDPSRNDIQVFALREKQGSLLKTPSSAGGLDLNGGTDAVTWVAGDDIKAIWIGQKINLDSTVGTVGSAGALGSSFGYLSFQNIAAADSAKTVEAAFGFSPDHAEAAWKWDTAFNMQKLGDPATAGYLGTPCLADAKGEITNPSVCTQLP